MMKKRSGFLVVFLLISALLVTACASKSATLDRVKKDGKIVVGVDTTYPPMEYVEGSKTVGWDVDLATAIAKQMGVKAEFVTVEWKGIIPGLQAKRYDIIMSSMNITAERQKELNFVEYVRASQVFVAKKGASFKSEKDLSGKTILVQDGTTSHEWAKDAKANRVKDIKDIISYDDATAAFQALKDGRGDVVVIDEPVGLYYSKKDPANFEITGTAINPEPIGIAVRKEDGDLQKALETALKAVKDDGTYKNLSLQWFGKELGGK